MIESSSFVVTCGTVLRAYHAFVGVGFIDASVVWRVPVVGALGRGGGTGLNRIDVRNNRGVHYINKVYFEGTT